MGIEDANLVPRGLFFYGAGVVTRALFFKPSAPTGSSGAAEVQVAVTPRGVRLVV